MWSLRINIDLMAHNYLAQCGFSYFSSNVESFGPVHLTGVGLQDPQNRYNQAF